MLKSFRLQGDILSYSSVPSQMLILPHLLKKLRKQNLFGNVSAAMLLLLCFLLFALLVHPILLLILKLLHSIEKNLKTHFVRNRRKLSRTVKYSDQSIHWAPGCYKDLFLYVIKLPPTAPFKKSEIWSRWESSIDHRRVGVGRYLQRSPSPTPLPKQDYLG